MIDDVDLQVHRIRELLPALRMLYHPNVFFIVAGDRGHMLDMLELDFQGQQRKLGETKSYLPVPPGPFDQWPRTLAEAAFQKVFAPANIWSLNALGLRELLAFPLQPIAGSEVRNLKGALNEWMSKSEKLGAQKGLGDYLDRVDRIGRFSQKEVRTTKGSGHGKAPESSEEQALNLPPIMFYRRAHQLSELVKSRGLSRNTALQVMDHIIQGSDCSNSDLKLGAAGRDDAGKLEYLPGGELAAIFPRVFSVDIDARKEFVLSGRPKFAFRSGLAKEARRADDQADIWPHVLAASLRADGFGLVASGLEWNVILALAWTRVQLPGLDLAFWWRVHLLPSPIRFAAWSRDWAKFIQQLSERAESTSGGEDRDSQRARVAYGWIYYQLRWMWKNPLEVPKLSRPLTAKVGSENMEDWTELLEQDPDSEFLKEEGDHEVDAWKNRTLPLLARPELFLPPHVQGALLQRMARSKPVIDDLRFRRTKLITDAITAGQYARNLTETPQSPKDVEALATSLNAEYREFYGEPSPWVANVETDVAEAGATESQLGS
jgi:hypothetical protein